MPVPIKYAAGKSFCVFYTHAQNTRNDKLIIKCSCNKHKSVKCNHNKNI